MVNRVRIGMTRLRGPKDEKLYVSTQPKTAPTYGYDKKVLVEGCKKGSINQRVGF